MHLRTSAGNLPSFIVSVKYWLDATKGLTRAQVRALRVGSKPFPLEAPSVNAQAAPIHTSTLQRARMVNT